MTGAPASPAHRAKRTMEKQARLRRPPAREPAESAAARAHRSRIAPNPLWNALAMDVRRAPVVADAALERAADERAQRAVEVRAPLAGDVPARTPSGVEPAPLRGVGAGSPIPEALRADYESMLGADLGAVRLHVGPEADRVARRIRADAFAAGEHVVFAAGHFQPDAPGGRRLIAHELAHVLQQRTGAAPPGLQRRRRGPRSRQPFARVLERHATVTAALAQVIETVAAIQRPPAVLSSALGRLQLELERSRERDAGARSVVDAYAAGDEPPVGAAVDALNYVLDDAPSVRGLTHLEQSMSRTILLAQLVRPRITDLGRAMDTVPADSPPEIRDAYATVAGLYVDTIFAAWHPRAMEPFLFLESFYADPDQITAYAIARHVGNEIPRLYERLRSAAPGGDIIPVLAPDIRPDDRAGSSIKDQGRQGDRYNAIVAVHAWMLDLLRTSTAIGELPSSLEELRTVPTAAQVDSMARQLERINVGLAIVTLWQFTQPLRSLIYSHNAIGTSLVPWADQPRQRWLGELTAIEIALAEEFMRADHPGIDQRLAGWAARLQAMIDVVPGEARMRHIVAAIVGQLPFLFVAGATVARLGMIVRGLTTSRWIVAFVEGSAMTAFTALGTPQGAPGRPSTAIGWASHLVLNVGWARVGRFLFDIAGDAAGRIALSRLAFINIGTRVVAPSVALATLQSTAQLLEARVRGQGGDTSFTELLTINLAMHGLGMVVGLATMPPRPTGGAGALAPRSVAALSREANVPEDVAALMLEVQARSDAFMASTRAGGEAARRGTLTPAQFAAYRDEGLSTADFLEPRLVRIAAAGALPGRSAADVQSFFAVMRARLQSATYSARPQVTVVLPQSVEGLTQVGDGPTWTYSASRPPPNLAALRASYVQRNHTIRALAGGGFEAVSAQGSSVAQVIPTSAAAPTPTTLAQVASGPAAAAGLARVRAQTAVAVNVLEAQLQGAAQSSARGVAVILQRVGALLDPSNGPAWRGLSNYFALGGDATLLAGRLGYGAYRENAAESRLLVDRLLTSMAGWDEAALNGFAALYRVHPRMTSARLLNLFNGDLAPEAPAILLEIARLEPISAGLAAVIGPLTSGARNSEAGARGTLAAAMRLADRFPQARLRFEVDVLDATGVVVRRIDISVVETHATRVAGVPRTSTIERAYEVKEVSTASLGRRAPQELARDIARDSALRATRPVAVGGARPFFETFDWLIRRSELQQAAIRRLGTANPTPWEVEREMRQMVAGSLRAALQRPEFLALDPQEQAGYRAAFEGGPMAVPFVEFF